MAVITLTTDFGLNDAYVAAIKGVILGINPEASLVDVCHTIQPQDVFQAAFVLSTVYQFFPHKTVHLVVVDPGVGTERKAIILMTPTACFVAPDNGVLSFVVHSYLKKPVEVSQQVELPPELIALAINKAQFWRSPVSATFHGRDIFAPVAARLSLGFAATTFGDKIPSVFVLPLPYPRLEPDGSVAGSILHIDSFGNLITSMKGEDLPASGKGLVIEVRGHFIQGLSRTYAEGEGLIALIGSSNYLEISINGGSASNFLGARQGDRVLLRRR